MLGTDLGEDRADVQSVIGVRRPRCEAVAHGEVARRGHRAGDLVESAGAGLDREDGAQQAARVLVGRVREQFLGGGLLDDLAGVHDGDVVCHLGDERQVVGHEDHGEAELLAQLVKQSDDLFLNGDVQGGGRLVRNDELRVAGQGHGDENALTLAARELVRVGLEGALGIQAHELEEFLGAAGAAAAGQLLHLSLDQHGGVQGRQGVLVDHRHLVAEQRAALLTRLLEQVLTLVEDFARDLCLGIDEAHDGEGRNRLAAAGLAHEAHGLAGADLEGHVVDDVDVAVTLELDAQVLDLEQRGLLEVGLEAIGALLLDGLEVVEASLQGGSLLSVGTARVEQELVGLAVGVLIDLCNSGGRGGRDHRVRNAFGQEVQAQHGDHDEQAGERGCPPHALQDRAVRRGLGQDVAPRGHGGRLEARTDEGQGGLEDDRVGDEDGREHEDRGGGVAQDVLDEDPGGAGAGDDHRADVVLAVRGHDVRANDTRQLRDVDEGDRTDDDHHEACRVTRLGEGSPKNEDRHGRHGDTGHRHDDVEDAHDRLGDALAHNRGDGADDRTEEERDQRRA